MDIRGHRGGRATAVAQVRGWGGRLPGLAGGFGACSLMTNGVDFTTYEFSALNGGIIRANAVEWAHDDEGHDH